ncbi:MAG TPA: hypothetical protein VIX73_18580, partial [Kofleriaceae bacterium]
TQCSRDRRQPFFLGFFWVPEKGAPEHPATPQRAPPRWWHIERRRSFDRSYQDCTSTYLLVLS